MSRIAFMTYAHNAEKSLEKTVESVLNQTYDELVYYLIDNASTDNTLDIMEGYARKDSRVKVIKNENSLVALPDYIKSIKDCEYFAVLDADDWYETTFAEELIGFAEAQDLDIAVCGSTFYEVEDGQTSLREIGQDIILEKEDILENMDSIFPHFRAMWAKIFRMNIIRKMDFSDFNQLVATKTFLCVDQLFCLETLRHANRVGMFDKILHTYLVYPQSDTYKYHPQRALTVIFSMQVLEAFLTRDGKLSEKNDALLSHVCLADLCFTAKNIMKFDVEMKCRLSELLKIVECPIVQRYIDDAEERKRAIMDSLVAAVSQVEVDEEVAALFFDCVEGLHADHIWDKLKNQVQASNELYKSDAESMQKWKDSPLHVQIEDVIWRERATEVFVIDADYVLSEIPELPVYDMIVLQGVAEHIETSDTMALLRILLSKVKKQIILITPEYCKAEAGNGDARKVRRYHPVAFADFDFAYSEYRVDGQSWQMYNIFPSMNDEPLPCDEKVTSDTPSLERLGRKLRIAYIIPHHNLTGGMKALLQQMKYLALSGHTIKAYYRSESSECQSAIPAWSESREHGISEQHVITKDQKFLDFIRDVDIIMLAWFSFIDELKDSDLPVVLWEQGYPQIFGDFEKGWASNDIGRTQARHYYRQPVHLLVVSPLLIDILRSKYNRRAQYFPNGIDTEVYKPGAKTGGLPAILIMGQPEWRFKGVEYAFTVLNQLWNQEIKFKVWWVLPNDFPLNENMFPYEVEQFVKPSQEKLARLFRQATLFFSTSLYESFSMPPMEAMASGTAVVATDNGGISRTYGRHGENCVLVGQGDTVFAAGAIGYLLENQPAREELEKAGRETALRYSFDKIVPILESCLYRIID